MVLWELDRVGFSIDDLTDQNKVKSFDLIPFTYIMTPGDANRERESSCKSLSQI